MPFRLRENETNTAHHSSPATPLLKTPWLRDFVAFAVQSQVLRFGNSRPRPGACRRTSSTLGLFDDGAKLGRLAEFYARRLIESGLQFDMFFGPAYKGITWRRPCPSSWPAWGTTSPLPTTAKGQGTTARAAPGEHTGAGRVLIIDDVISQAPQCVNH